MTHEGVTGEVEKVARAIYEARNGQGTWPDSIGRDNWAFHAAIAAMEELMEPSEEMAKAALAAVREGVSIGWGCGEYCSTEMDIDDDVGRLVIRRALARALSPSTGRGE